MHAPNVTLHTLRRLVSALPEWAGHAPARSAPVIGVLPGEGIGPEIMDAMSGIFDTLNKVSGESFEVRIGGKIGLPAQAD